MANENVSNLINLSDEGSSPGEPCDVTLENFAECGSSSNSSEGDSLTGKEFYVTASEALLDLSQNSFDFLQTAGSNAHHRSESNDFGRLSLFKKFDPLIASKTGQTCDEQ
ncbi:unnamed protein product [Soboliphyme baturini]|uniref:ICA69 domain-containing protein n=1 Tax=Soboliphyme baturini TaxID=241478 RepID=A0A183J6F7_9BILA|nr:unnamed protein product [Soboliphyme baturini]